MRSKKKVIIAEPRIPLPVLSTAALFAILSLFGYHVFGWRLDGFVLILAGVIHVTVFLRFYPRLDLAVILVHYAILFISIGGILWVLWGTLGAPLGSCAVLLMLLRDSWSHGVAYSRAGAFLLATTLGAFILIAGIIRILKGRCPNKYEAAAGFFVVSILVFPCFFAVADPLAKIVVVEPTDAQSFAFAVGLGSLEFPLLFHALTLGMISVLWRR